MKIIIVIIFLNQNLIKLTYKTSGKYSLKKCVYTNVNFGNIYLYIIPI